jgi:predicted transport protein
MILIDGVRYHLWTPQDEEKEFHPIIKQNSKEIFGQDTLFFDVRHKLQSKSGIASIPDGYVIDFSKTPSWYVVEVELSSHPVHEHVVNQLSRFISGLGNTSSRNEITRALYDVIDDDKELRGYVEKNIGSGEIFRFLTELIQEDPVLVIIIDEATEEVKEACEALARKPLVLEYKVFRRENAESVHAYSFETLKSSIREVSGKKEEKKERKKIPEHYESWDKMLAWVEPQTKELALSMIKDIRDEFSDVVDKPSGKYYRFFKGREGSTTCFAALILTKKKIHVRVRIDPDSFSDPQHWLVDHVYKGWFMPGRGQEREFLLDSNSQLDYSMKLITQSYALAT